MPESIEKAGQHRGIGEEDVGPEHLERLAIPVHRFAGEVVARHHQAPSALGGAAERRPIVGPVLDRVRSKHRHPGGAEGTAVAQQGIDERLFGDDTAQ